MEEWQAHSGGVFGEAKDWGAAWLAGWEPDPEGDPEWAWDAAAEEGCELAEEPLPIGESLEADAYFAQEAEALEEEAGADPPTEPGTDLAVTITCDAGADLRYGDVVTLTAEIRGAEGLDYLAEWMFNDGSGWKTAFAGAALTYQFVVTEQNAGWGWMMALTVGMG